MYVPCPMTNGLVAYNQQGRGKTKKERKKKKLHASKLKVLKTMPGKVRAQKLLPTTSQLEAVLLLGS